MKIKVNEFYIDNKKLFKCDVKVVKGINLFVGDNGSGKSSLYNLLYKLNLDYDGCNFLDCFDVCDLRVNVCSYLNQSNLLFENLSFKQNLELICESYDVKRFEIFCNVFDVVSLFESKTAVRKFSGGQIQKIKIILCLIKDVDIYILDEPFNDLDKESVEFLTKYLNELDAVVLLSTHFTKSINPSSVHEISNNEVVSKYFEEVDFEIKSASKSILLDKLKFKTLRNLTKKSVLYLSLLNMFFVLFILFNFNSIAVKLNDSIITTTKFEFADDSTIIMPPVDSSYLSVYGDESWLENISSYFDEEDLKKIESLSGVTEVVPITSPLYVSSSLTDGEFIIDESIDMSLYKDSEFFSEQPKELVYAHAMRPKDISKSIPIQNMNYYGQKIIKMLEGDIPNDESNEVLIDQFYATKLMNELKLNNFSEVISQEIDLNIKNITNEDILSKKYIVSGIIEVADTNQSSVMLSYNPNSQNVIENQSWKMDNNQLKDIINNKLKNAKFNEVTQMCDTCYNALYIKSSTEQKQLVKDILDYDKFIRVENNYVYENMSSIRYLKSSITKDFIKLFIFVIIYAIVNYLIFKLFKRDLNDVMFKLDYYGYCKGDILKYLKQEQSNLIQYVIITTLFVFAIAYLLNLSQFLVVMFVITVICQLVVWLIISLMRFKK